MSKQIDAPTIKRMLESYFWPETLHARKAYTRQHDDTDGEDAGKLTVFFDEQGDAFLCIDNGDALRFRTFGGGGLSGRTRNALLILAEAIRLDNEGNRF
jgi:hypothetical protein